MAGGIVSVGRRALQIASFICAWVLGCSTDISNCPSCKLAVRKLLDPFCLAAMLKAPRLAQVLWASNPDFWKAL